MIPLVIARGYPDDIPDDIGAAGLGAWPDTELARGFDNRPDIASGRGWRAVAVTSDDLRALLVELPAGLLRFQIERKLADAAEPH